MSINSDLEDREFYKNVTLELEIGPDDLLPEYLAAFKKFLYTVGFSSDLEIVARYPDSETEISSDDLS